jgi:hypothetical protein
MIAPESIEPKASPQIIYRSLSEAARRFPSFRCGAPVHSATLTRWILAGVKDRDGNRIKLQAKRLPGRWVVTDDTISEFIEALTNDRACDSGPGQIAPQTSAARRNTERKCGLRSLRLCASYYQRRIHGYGGIGTAR